MALKQTIVIRADLKLPKGKLAAQAAHAAVEAAHKADKTNYSEWRHAGQKKVVVKVKDEKELFKVLQQAKDQGLTTSLITDAGKTVIAPGTNTCIAIGPNEEAEIDQITKDLPLL